MSEGMSSEELDKLTTEEEETPPVEEEETPPAEESDDEETPPREEDTDLAQAALDETAEKPEVDPKDAVIGGMRRDLRASERERYRLQGQLEAQQAKPPEPSPIELAAKEQEKPIDEVIIDGKLYKEQQAWEQKQATARTQQQQLDDFRSGSEAAVLTMTDETLGEGLGLESLREIGEHLLTEQDQREVYAAGKKCGAVLYKKLKERILDGGGTNAQELQKRLKPTQTKPKKEAKEKTSTKEKPASKPQDEGDESEVRASTNAIMTELEMF